VAAAWVLAAGEPPAWKPAAGPLMTRWAKDVDPRQPLPEYPRPQLVRKEWQSLNGLWQLAVARADEAPPVGKGLDQQILVPFPVESALSGVMKRMDRVWYRRTFTVPESWAGRRLLLHFGAVNWDSTVWLNGKKLGSHQGGYDGFSFDVTDALKPGGEQELILSVWNPADAHFQPRGKQVNKPEGIYYTPSTGIWQTVWLEPVPAAHISSLKIVPNVTANKVVVTVKCSEAESSRKFTATVRGPKTTAKMTGEAGKPLEIPLFQTELWTPESPHLLGLDVELLDDAGGQAVDRVASYFAMRQIGIGKDENGVTRLLLNGKPYFMVGPLDQGFWPDGLYTAPTDEALRYDIEVTKKLGFNMARKHVKVEPARWYYWCDKLGLLVWQDMPSGDKSVAPGRGEITRSPESAKQFELELMRMIDGLHNHPCIVMWVVFNEGWGQYDTVRLTDAVKQYDPTRLVNCASGWNDMNCGDVHDWHVYPGPGSPRPEGKRAAVLGEFGGLGLGVDGHTWTNKTWGYRGTASSEDLTRKYEQLLRQVYRLKDKPGLSAAVYTQTTDVETEANGLMTYDRAVIKVDVERVAAATRGDFSRVPELVAVVTNAQKEAVVWRYTLSRPPEGWQKPEFDDKAWQTGEAGFGTKGTPGAVVRTEWNTGDIWLRREFTLPEGAGSRPLFLSVHHDEDAEVYVNGVLAARLRGYSTDYEEVILSDAARAALKPGKNVFAVHCRQTTGGQYIDVGIVEVKGK
jgi:hypothetical protein